MQPDFEMIERFFNRIGERQRHTLAAIHPVKPGLQGSTYEFKQREVMLRYISIKQREGYGLYYSLNEGVPVFKQRGYNGKLLANEIIAIHMLGFDIDWIKGDQEARSGFETRAMNLLMSTETLIRPSLVVSSGGGIQVLYVLLSPLPVALSCAQVPTAAQAVTDRVAQGYRDDFTKLYADICVFLSVLFEPLIIDGICKIDKLSNIDRVFRLPGTINFPTPVKIEKGATVRLARVVYDEGSSCDFFQLREAIPNVTAAVERKEKATFKERENLTWSAYKKALFLCEYIRDHRLIDDNQNYTHDLMFPLFGMINRNEINAQQGRELWLLATSTGRETAYGDFPKKWDTRKIANYTGRDIGTIVYFCREHGCLMPWSANDQQLKTEQHAREITEDSLRHPVEADEEELFNFS